MSDKIRKNLNRVNFFDGQRVTEIDLDDEQFYFLNKINNVTVDFHSSGVLDQDRLNRKTLLDISNPGKYGENLSAPVISAGEYDGRGIYVDVQPSDSYYGNKLEIELTNSEARGRDKVKVLIVGKTFNSLEQDGDLVVELIEFSKDEIKLTKNYFTKINGIILNNYSGGSGSNEYGSTSYKKLGLSANLVIRESGPLKVFANSINVESVQSPNLEVATFGSSSPTRTLKEEINLLLTSEDVISDLFLDFENNGIVSLAANDPISKSFGQKFLNKSNNIQSIDVFLSTNGEDNWTGEIVFSLYELSTDVSASSSENYDRLIDFDPELTPISEVSYDKETLEDLGYKIGVNPTLVNFDFSGSFLANPNMPPELSKDKFYAFIISRRGDNSVGDIVLYKGYDRVYRKNELSKPLNPVDKYGRQESRFVEFDPVVKRYIDDYTSSLWFRVHSSSVEVTEGLFYAASGAAIVLPKFEEYVGNTLVPKSYSNIDLRDLSSGGKNYVVIEEKKSFVDADVHPRTGNFIFTRIQDSAEINVYNEQEYNNSGLDKSVVLSRVIDSNLRVTEYDEGEFDLPGLINEDYFYIINPDSRLITKNLIGKNFVPDTECQCANVYKIVDVECITSYLGDLDNSKKINSSDIINAIDLSGNSLGSEATELKILGGEVSIVDFYKTDVNNDGTIDGIDIDLLEQASEGSYNFSKPKKFNLLKIYVESLYEEGEKVIFSDTQSTSSTISGSSEIQITLEDYREGLSVRIGDLVKVSENEQDDGTYIISSKSFDVTTLLLTLTVTDENLQIPIFNGISNGNFSIISSKDTNLFVDNLDLLSVPYKNKTFSIYQSKTSFSQEKIDLCDMRRYVEFSFIELEDPSCLCVEEECVLEEECEPKSKNQKFLPNDLIISGDILGEDRLPYHGDYEYSNISFPLPPGDVSDCKIDLYNVFIKADGPGCLTSYGYQAMRYSDGTYVGCEDTPSSTDITKNRIKFLDAIASLNVASTQENANEAIVLNESYSQYITTYSNEYIYTGFSGWTEDPLNSSTNITITKNSSSVDMSLDTLESSGLRFARLDQPLESSGISGDFLVDVRMSRSTWDDESITLGIVRSGVRMIIRNDAGYSELKIGFYKNASFDTKYFYSLSIFDESDILLDEYLFQKDVEDDLDEDVIFRLRRIDDAVHGYSISPDNISFLDNTDEQFTKISGRMFRHAGYGDADISIFIEQDRAPTANQTFEVRFKDVEIKDNLSSEERLNEIITLGRNLSNNLTQSSLVTFPLNIGSSVVLNSATLSFVARSSLSSSVTLKIKKVDSINLDNVDPYYNYSVEEYIKTTIGPVSEGERISIDVVNLVAWYLSQIGHLPGFKKGFYIEIGDDSSGALNINPNDFSLSISYSNTNSGETFKVGMDLDQSTGVLSLSTKNILYDYLDPKNRTVIKVGVLLKKKGFINGNVELSLTEVKALGVGDCSAEESLVVPGIASVDGCESYFIAGITMPGSLVDGAYASNLHYGESNCVESVTDGEAILVDSTVTEVPAEEEIPAETETPVEAPVEEVVTDPDWEPSVISEQLLWWTDFSDPENYDQYSSVVPQKLSNGDSGVYNLLEVSRDLTGNGNNLVIPSDFSADLGLRSSVSPVIVKDNFLKKTFARFDGIRNFMQVENSNVSDFRSMSTTGVSVFIAAKLGNPTKNFGSPTSSLFSRFKEKRAILLGKGTGNIESSDFTLSIRDRSLLGGKSNYLSWERNNQEVGSISEIIDKDAVTVYSFQTSSTIAPELYENKGFFKNSIDYGYNSDENFNDEQVIGENPTSSYMFLGGLPYKATETLGIYNGLNLSGDIYEIVVVSGEVGKFTRETIEGYLAHKYGFESKLPENHRFKENPPKRSDGSVIIRS